MWKIIFAAIMTVVLTVSVNAIEIGDTYFPLDRPEVVTQGGGYGPNIDITDLINAGTVTVVAFGYES